MPGWINHKPEPRLPGEITITSDMQIIPHLWQKVPQYIRQMLTSMKGEINSNTIIVGDFNIPLTPMDRSTKWKITKETQL